MTYKICPSTEPNVTSLKPQASVIFERYFTFSRIKSKCHSDRFSFVPWQLFGVIWAFEMYETLQQTLTDGQEPWWHENAKHKIYDEYHCHEWATVMKESYVVIYVCVVTTLSLYADIQREARKDNSAVTTSLKLFPMKSSVTLFQLDFEPPMWEIFLLFC